MAGRIVVFGASGYTGRLTVDALVARGCTPVLAGRQPDRLAATAQQLGGLETAGADVSDPASVRRLVGPGDVLVTTVGPFTRLGGPALQAAVEAGAHYLDSTGESTFIRRVFEGARDARGAVLTAFGYDFVPGNLAGALSLDLAGGDAATVDIGYFTTGPGGFPPSSGTRATSALSAVDPQLAFRGGRLVSEPALRRVRSFDIGGRELLAGSIGGSEHFGLPRFAPRLRDVGVYLGWFGPAVRRLQKLSLATSVLTRVPGVRPALSAAAWRATGRTTGVGPDADMRERVGSHIVAVTSDAGGRPLSRVDVAGVNGYTLTGALLAWAADRLAAGEVHGSGALAPVEAFGLDGLLAGCRECGLDRV